MGLVGCAAATNSITASPRSNQAIPRVKRRLAAALAQVGSTPETRQVHIDTGVSNRPEAGRPSFNHLVGALLKLQGHVKAQCPCGLEIDDEIEFCRRHHRPPKGGPYSRRSSLPVRGIS